MKAAAQATYGRKGQDVVEKNWAAIDAGAKGIVKVEVPESWKNCEDEGLDYAVVTEGRKDVVDFVNNIQTKVSAQEGNTLPDPACIRVQGLCGRLHSFRKLRLREERHRRKRTFLGFHEVYPV